MSGRRTTPEIDREKVRAQIRRLDGTGLLVWLDRAIDMLPDEAFPELVADYVHLRDIVSDGRTRPDLLHTIRRFHRESMTGRYYQEFEVNSRNFMEKSRGTENFIAEHSRLLDACMRAERAGDLKTARAAAGRVHSCEGQERSGRRDRERRSPAVGRTPFEAGGCAQFRQQQNLKPDWLHESLVPVPSTLNAL